MNAMLKIGDFVDFVEPEESPAAVSVNPARWFLIRVHPLIERRVQRKLTQRGVSCYVPQYPKQVSVARQFPWQKPIVQRRIVPLFPGLVFVPDVDADIAHLRRLADGVVGFLYVSERPARVSHDDMEDIRAIESRQCVPVSALRKGSTVRIREGSPFAMWTGRIERLDDRGRLRVLIDVIKREVAVELSSHQVEPVEQATVC
jgi:transcription antitermination factor NusG